MDEITLEQLLARVEASELAIVDLEAAIAVLNDPIRAAVINVTADTISQSIPDIFGPAGGFVQAALAQAARAWIANIYDSESPNVVLPDSSEANVFTGTDVGSNAAGILGSGGGGGGGGGIIPFVMNKSADGTKSSRRGGEGLEEAIRNIELQLAAQVEDNKQRLIDKGDNIMNQDFAIARDKALHEIMHLYAEVTTKIEHQRDNAIAAVRAVQPKQSRNADNASFETSVRTVLD